MYDSLLALLLSTPNKKMDPSSLPLYVHRVELTGGCNDQSEGIALDC